MNGYYAVAGKNAYGVYTNYAKMQKDRTYIAAFRCQRCDSYEEAKQEAELIFNLMQSGNPFGYKIEEIERINWCYYKKRL